MGHLVSKDMSMDNQSIRSHLRFSLIKTKIQLGQSCGTNHNNKLTETTRKRIHTSIWTVIGSTQQLRMCNKTISIMSPNKAMQTQ